MNQVTLAGKLGQTPQLRYTNNMRIPVTTLRVATKENDSTVWHNVTVWSKQAELCCKFLEKGSRVIINARLTYEQTLIDEKQITIPTVVANHVEFI